MYNSRSLKRGREEAEKTEKEGKRRQRKKEKERRQREREREEGRRREEGTLKVRIMYCFFFPTDERITKGDQFLMPLCVCAEEQVVAVFYFLP